MNTKDIGNTLLVGGIRKSPCAIVESVRNDLLTRSEIGLSKYGMTLGENPASRKERLQHAYEEALDLANYLKWEEMRDGPEAVNLMVMQAVCDVASGRCERAGVQGVCTVYEDRGTVWFDDHKGCDGPQEIGRVNG